MYRRLLRVSRACNYAEIEKRPYPFPHLLHPTHVKDGVDSSIKNCTEYLTDDPAVKEEEGIAVEIGIAVRRDLAVGKESVVEEGKEVAGKEDSCKVDDRQGSLPISLTGLIAQAFSLKLVYGNDHGEKYDNRWHSRAH